MPNDDRAERGRTDPEHPWILIPYFSGDQGRTGIERPLTGIFYRCPSIVIEGVNYTPLPGFYEPGEPLSITVLVDNRGIPSAQVTVHLYWSDPATGFATPTFIGSDTFPVAGRSILGPTPSNPIVWTPERAKIPAHFCLLAKAACFPPEPTPVSPVPDPVNDRHWAQYNLMAVSVSPFKTTSAVFWAVNPDTKASAFTVSAEPLSEKGLKELSRVVRAEPVLISQEQITLSPAIHQSEHRSSRDATVLLELDPGSRQPLVVTARAAELSPHQFTAIQLIQTRVSGNRQSEVIGSLAIILYPSNQPSLS